MLYIGNKAIYELQNNRTLHKITYCEIILVGITQLEGLLFVHCKDHIAVEAVLLKEYEDHMKRIFQRMFENVIYIKKRQELVEQTFQITTIAMQHGQKFITMKLGNLFNVSKQIVLLSPQAQWQIFALEYVGIVLQSSEETLHVGLLGVYELLENRMHALIALIT